MNNIGLMLLISINPFPLMLIISILYQNIIINYDNYIKYKYDYILVSVTIECIILDECNIKKHIPEVNDVELIMIDSIKLIMLKLVKHNLY